MANRQQGYGFSAEVANRIASKYDPQLEAQAVQWINNELGTNIATGVDNVQQALQDGTLLCQLINKLQPGSVRKINTSKLAFMKMENIGNFLTACQSYGVPPNDLFQTVDLYEGVNMVSVINTLHALGRRANAPGFVRESQSNKRNFSQDQLRQGEGVVGLQAGYNQGANQSGTGGFGGRRNIY